MNTGQRATVACFSLMALAVLVASSPLGGSARSAAYVGIQPDSPALKHIFYPGKAFDASPANFTMLGSCIEVILVESDYAPVLLPEGSIVKYLTMYYVNSTVQTALTVSLVAHEIALGWPTHTTVAEASGTIVNGWETVTSAEVSHTIDMSSTTYTIELMQPYDSSRLTYVCGVRIDYIPPSIFAIALPSIVR